MAGKKCATGCEPTRKACLALGYGYPKRTREISSSEHSRLSNMGSHGMDNARQLRDSDPGRYGVAGTQAGDPGYVKGGWQLAVKDAGKMNKGQFKKGNVSDWSSKGGRKRTSLN